MSTLFLTTNPFVSSPSKKDTPPEYVNLEEFIIPLIPFYHTSQELNIKIITAFAFSINYSTPTSVPPAYFSSFSSPPQEGTLEFISSRGNILTWAEDVPETVNFSKIKVMVFFKDMVFLIKPTHRYGLTCLAIPLDSPIKYELFEKVNKRIFQIVRDFSQATLWEFINNDSKLIREISEDFYIFKDTK